MTKQWYSIDLSTGKLSVFRLCPTCIKALPPDSQFAQDESKMRQKQRKDGGWYHPSPLGKRIHKWAEKKLAGADGD